MLKLEKSSLNTTNRCVYLEKCNLALEQKLNEYEQSSRKLNIEIVGVEYLPNENVKDIVTKIGDEIGVSSHNIEWVKRSRPAKQGAKPSPIIIGFKASGVECRNKWLEKRRQMFEKSITSNMIIPGGSVNNRIYINEDLIPTTRALLWNAKKQLHGVCKYIWVSNGKILVKKAEGEKTIWLRSQSDIRYNLNSYVRTGRSGGGVLVYTRAELCACVCDLATPANCARAAEPPKINKQDKIKQFLIELRSILETLPPNKKPWWNGNKLRRRARAILVHMRLANGYLTIKL
ncbi:hypothetical protein SFRURICE_021166 [Spodoptera frugiperda]|nr:hypothetical protein SFRURICE_021166 [Spodoptera frugiperda]